MSHPTMGAWIEIVPLYYILFILLSHPTMGAWIEILKYGVNERNEVVAPHDGCVD